MIKRREDRKECIILYFCGQITNGNKSIFRVYCKVTIEDSNVLCVRSRDRIDFFLFIFVVYTV